MLREALWYYIWTWLTWKALGSGLSPEQWLERESRIANARWN